MKLFTQLMKKVSPLNFSYFPFELPVKVVPKRCAKNKALFAVGTIAFAYDWLAGAQHFMTTVVLNATFKEYILKSFDFDKLIYRDIGCYYSKNLKNRLICFEFFSFFFLIEMTSMHWIRVVFVKGF